MLNDVETRDNPIEKLSLALYFSYTKLKYYLVSIDVYVISMMDVIKYMLSSLILYGRVGKWMLALTKFSLFYVPAKVVKGQMLANFLLDHPCVDIDQVDPLLSVDKGKEDCYIELKPWKLYFDGSQHQNGAGVSILIISPNGEPTKLMFELNYECTNNEA